MFTMIRLGLILIALCLSATGAFASSQYSVSSNSGDILRIKNYLGNYENIHPKVLYFANGWNGYEYWMAYTPYPGGETYVENPCIAVSHDGIEWTTPEGLSNPLALAFEDGYNSDTHLVYNPDSDTLECWWREYYIPGTQDRICRRVSKDGIMWGEKEVILPYNDDEISHLSPAVWIQDGRYKMIYCNRLRLYLISSLDPTDTESWSEPVLLPVNWGDLKVWHQDVVLNDEGNLEMVVCGFFLGGDNNTADLYYVEMASDLSYASEPVLILARGENESDFDSRSIYRSSLLKVDGTYKLYYSAIDMDWNRCMSLMQGPSPTDLTGLPEYGYQEHDDLIINELMQSNVDCVIDGQNGFPPSWVEIYNPTSGEVNLGNYKLGVDADPENAFQLPSEVSVAPDSHCVVLCDKKGSGMHADFRLDSQCGKVYLFKNDVVIDSIPEISVVSVRNIAYGRRKDGNGIWGWQLSPSPGSPNQDGITDIILGEPIFSVAGRVCHEPFYLELSLPADTPPGTVIKCTLDGSEPSFDSPNYTSPLAINKSVAVKAKLINKDAVSPCATVNSYIFRPDEINIPLVSLVTDFNYLLNPEEGKLAPVPSDCSSERRIPVYFEYFEKNSTDSAAIHQLAETTVEGFDSDTSSVKSLVIYSDERFGSDRFNHEFFPSQKGGVVDFKAIELTDGRLDGSPLDGFAQRIMGQYTDLDWLACQPTAVYLNGEYYGLMNLRERADENYVYTYYGGPEDIDFIVVGDTVSKETCANFSAFKDFYRQEHLTLDEYREWMNVEEFINYVIANMLVCNFDAWTDNLRMWRPRRDRGKWRWICNAMDSPLGVSSIEPDVDYLLRLCGDSIDHNAGSDLSDATLLLRQLFAIEEFRELFIDKCLIYLGDFLRFEEAHALLADMIDEIESEQKAYGSGNLSSDSEREVGDSIAVNFLKKRFELLPQHLANRENVDKLTRVVVRDIEKVLDMITLQDIPLQTGSFDGQYFVGRPLKIEGKSSEESGLEGWVVEIYVDDILLLTDLYREESFEFIVPEADEIHCYPTNEFLTMPDPGLSKVPAIWKYYNLSGLEVKMHNLLPGVYIVLMSDGSSRKIMIH